MTTEGGDRIKSAFEKAMEKIAQLEAPSKQDRLAWKGVPQGNQIATQYLKDGKDPKATLDQVESELRPYVLQGFVDVLAGNIQLPRSEAAAQTTSRALEGLRIVLSKKNSKAGEIVERAKYVCDQYKTYGAQQRQQVYEQLKQQFASQVQEALRRKGMRGDVPNLEATPEFQQEWTRVRISLDQQYEQHLDAVRGELRAMAGLH